MTEFDRLLDRRHSTRAFLPDAIPEAEVEEIVRAASKAPSAGNLQSYRIVRVEGRKKENIAKASYGQDFISGAPLCLVFCSDPRRSSREYGQRGASLYSIQDATIAAAFAVLKAVDLGYGTAWVGAFDEDTVSSIIEESVMRPVAVILAGLPAEKPVQTARRDIVKIFRTVV